MSPFTDDFVNACLKAMKVLEPGMYLTREAIATKAGYKEYSDSVSHLVAKDSRFSKYKSTRGKGITVV